jgi:hypothetical protein
VRLHELLFGLDVPGEPNQVALILCVLTAALMCSRTASLT